MKRATDPQEKAVQNGRQLALKVSANSVYGFTGATVGQLPCLAIASAVTSYGRDLLLQTKDEVEKHYTIENGYSANATVVYGDTDSVMINFGVPTVAEAMPLAQEAAALVTTKFPHPVMLEFEKVYWPYLLMNKKRYAGLLWTNPDKHDYMDCKGLETVRRDNCLLVRTMIDTCLRKIIIERNVDAAINYAKQTISDLLQNKIDFSYLVVTKSLGKSADSEEYKAKQAHVELAARMKKRDPANAPNVGDRVPYIFVQKAKGTPGYERSECPIFALDNNLPVDYKYYLEHQLSKPLLRIFEPIIDDPKTLISGDHTRCLHVPTPVARAGSIMSFAVKKLKCMACKAPIADKGGKGVALCQHCKGNESMIYMEKMERVNKQAGEMMRILAHTVHPTPHTMHHSPHTPHHTPCTILIHHTPCTTHTPYTMHYTPLYFNTHHLTIPRPIFQALDTVPAMSRIHAPRCPVLQWRLPYLLQAEEGAEED
jgi:DNA polymerase delta subunit 1